MLDYIQTHIKNIISNIKGLNNITRYKKDSLILLKISPFLSSVVVDMGYWINCNNINGNELFIYEFIFNIIMFIFLIGCVMLLHNILNFKRYIRFNISFILALVFCIFSWLRNNIQISLINIISYFLLLIISWVIIYIIIYILFHKSNNGTDIKETKLEKGISSLLIIIISLNIMYYIFFVAKYLSEADSFNGTSLKSTINSKSLNISKVIKDVWIYKINNESNTIKLSTYAIFHFILYYGITALAILIFIGMLTHYYTKNFRNIFKNKNLSNLYGSTITGYMTVFGTMLASLYLLNPNMIFGDSIIFLFNYFAAPLLLIGIWLNLEKTFEDEITNYKILHNSNKM